MQNFEQLDLRPHTLAALHKMGFQTPTAIQEQAIPVLLSGRDVIAQARTGTGKTAAFGIPAIEGSAAEGSPGVLVLVLVPTRELATQVAQELQRLAHGTRVRPVALYGGVGFDAQARALKQRDSLLVVATPGRLLDHIGRRTIRLDGVRMLVLDEADRMLDMGFLPDVERILQQLPADRQTALFSATIPAPIRRLADRFLQGPLELRAESGPAPVPEVDQVHLQVPADRKTPALQRLLEHEAPHRAIVFTRTKHRARSLARSLERTGWAAVALQGNMSQAQRERALADFRNGRARVLVATDVASRGLDVPDVSHVVNLDFPAEPDAYVHRIGRTARMGRRGKAITFVQPNQARELRHLESSLGVRIPAHGLDMGGLPPPATAPSAPADGPGGPQRRFPHRARRRSGPHARAERFA